MEITLKPTQLQILSNIQATKEALQTEFGRVISRENEIIAVICEDHGAEPAEGMKIQDGKLIIPTKSEKIMEEYLEKLT